ncbi:pentapeptide repeat-containing protein [Allokutzneria oryzae]|uniref:Pentapeptide repeat-containing protein n=1 Tax=Allokutzneria oryzae TaxID=1378989 RepID=A0ABV6A5L8_9PSEU
MEPADPVLRPFVVFLWAAVAVAVTVGLTTFLVHLSDGADPQRLAGLLDIVRIGLSVGIGTGGLFALWLATRRQRSAEQTLALQREVSQTTVNDSTERRITEQYNKAIEQLGHEKAAVRLGAIYSLERIAQEHAGHRQTVIDVFCSYLRLPYEPPADRKRWSKSSAGLSPEAAEALAELEVRYTIQGMFWEHLGDPEKRKVGEKHWPDLVLNLSRATLVDPVLRFLAVRGLWCEQLVVHGTADFRGLRVTHIASFVKARFHDRAVFADGIFSESVALIDCTFEAGADLSGAAFLGLVTLIGCDFRGEVDLGGHSSRGFAAHNCQFDHGLVLRGGKCTLVMISDSDLQGTFVTDDLEVSAGLLAGCSFRTQPDRHPKIVLVDDLRDSDSYWRGVAAHFGIEFDGTMMST